MSTGKEPTPVFYREGDATVCLLVTKPGKVISRGVAICAEDEDYEPKVGMAKSKGKAMQARHHRKNVSPVRESFGEFDEWPWPANLHGTVACAEEELGFELRHKGMYRPAITEREKKLAETMESEILENEQVDCDNIFKRVFDTVRKVSIVIFRM
jgi:hypothetical protein